MTKPVKVYWRSPKLSCEKSRQVMQRELHQFSKAEIPPAAPPAPAFSITSPVTASDLAAYIPTWRRTGTSKRCAILPQNRPPGESLFH